MSSQEEYSSDEESIYDSQNKKQKVLLGFVDGPITEKDKPTIEDTFLGSQPIWFYEDSKPAESMLICDNCKSKLSLYLQANSPLENTYYDRIIYLFGCKNSQCSKKKGSIKVIRGINKNDEVIKRNKNALDDMDDQLNQSEDKQKQLSEEITKNLFKKNDDDEEEKTKQNPFGGSNPFGDSSTNPFDSNSNPFDKKPEKKQENSKEVSTQQQPKTKTSYAEIASKNAPPPSKPSKSIEGELPEYPGNFIYIESEKLKKDKTTDEELAKYKHLIEQSQENDDDEQLQKGSSKRRESSSSAVLDPQTTKISNMLDDKYFENFSNKTKSNPGQILRYDLNGKPLLYNGKDDIAKIFLSEPFNIPKPSYNPSSSRRFEFQLMPNAIMNLEDLNNNTNKNIKDILNGMSWGTIIVCTDFEDYIPDEMFDKNKVGYIQEWCGVQWEESV
ncbi:uncharacterized protein KGF55_005102 [Candida pseudojiufengensis]|uniref:uncharacterized protein n=1 Tax=Candida pseudojiufengensis TaxID=497109 RepID=UPI0022246E8B|nr:uncharacterized protein KGF55_005102 [Candida pseudojiufengensis]KAI5959870.1 hypothetical protein KGF55_005102 [Candida pseudojiufengensis]